MKNKISILIISGISIVIIFMLITHIINKSRNKSAIPFKFNIEDYKAVDDELISHKEVRQIILPDKDYVDILYKDGKIFLLSKNNLKIMLPDGSEVLEIETDSNSSAFTVCKSGLVYVCFGNYIVIYDSAGIEIKRSSSETDNSYFTSIAVSDKLIFIADAGRRQVIIYDNKFTKISSFTGESGVSDVHGLIVPGNHFSLEIDAYGELWVVNPGIHAIQNYSHQGRLRGYWSKTSYHPEGFTGCCNPSYLRFLSDGNMLTSEKGLVRVKIHKIYGELVSVVAPPDKFKNGRTAPAITSDENDNIIILDFDRNMIRFFNKIGIFEN